MGPDEDISLFIGSCEAAITPCMGTLTISGELFDLLLLVNIGHGYLVWVCDSDLKNM